MRELTPVLKEVLQWIKCYHTVLPDTEKSLVEGKGFTTLAQKSSLATKEKNWNWLIQKMLIHLETKIKTDFKNEII